VSGWMENDMRKRGPIRGRHVSLIGWLVVVCKIYGILRGSTSGPPQHLTPSHDRPTIGPRVSSYLTYGFNII
jgi:hypothetical protein